MKNINIINTHVHLAALWLATVEWIRKDVENTWIRNRKIILVRIHAASHLHSVFRPLVPSILIKIHVAKLAHVRTHLPGIAQIRDFFKIRKI